MGILRSIILAMAGSPFWKRLLTGLPVTGRVVSRFIPGESLDEALETVAVLNRAGHPATLSHLGENVESEEEADAAADAYIEILDRIAAWGLDSRVAVKLTMLGLDLEPEIAERNLRRVLEAADRHGNFVGLDMESSDTVDETLALWRGVRSDHPRVGVVTQSYLRRSAEDIENLIEEGASIRVVKGAYQEPPEVAFPDKESVDRRFVEILERLAEPDARAAGVQVAVASHDPEMVAAGRRLIEAHGLDEWEFQMLYGIGRDLQEDLREEGYRVRIYVSYGPAWYPWFMRRLAERPANLLFFVRHLLS